MSVSTTGYQHRGEHYLPLGYLRGPRRAVCEGSAVCAAGVAEHYDDQQVPRGDRAQEYHAGKILRRGNHQVIPDSRHHRYSTD